METSSALQQEPFERRRFERLSLTLDTDMILFSGNRAGDQVFGQIINITKEGVGAVLRRDVVEGTQVALTIFSEEDQSTCSGEIIWKKEVKGRTVHGIKISQWSYIAPSLESQLSLA